MRQMGFAFPPGCLCLIEMLSEDRCNLFLVCFVHIWGCMDGPAPSWGFSQINQLFHCSFAVSHLFLYREWHNKVIYLLRTIWPLITKLSAPNDSAGTPICCWTFSLLVWLKIYFQRKASANNVAWLWSQEQQPALLNSSSPLLGSYRRFIWFYTPQ